MKPLSLDKHLSLPVLSSHLRLGLWSTYQVVEEDCQWQKKVRTRTFSKPSDTLRKALRRNFKLTQDEMRH